MFLIDVICAGQRRTQGMRAIGTQPRSMKYDYTSLAEGTPFV